MKNYILLSVICLFAYQLKAQSVSDFTLTDVKSKSPVSLNDFKNKKGVAIIFTSNVCPYSVYYEGRITQLVSDFSDDIQFILINSLSDGKESEEEMRNKIAAWGINVPYLSDKSKTVLNALGAKKSPEVFLLKSTGGTFSVYYKGAIDNNPQVASDVKEQYLKNNLKNMMEGKSAVHPGTRPIGCMIK
jgi:peroxiredoxin